MSIATPPGWMPAQAPWPRGVQAGFSLRAGGCSVSPWGSLNLGDHVGDDPACVAQNRQALRQQLGVQWRFMRQVHGSEVLALDHHTPDGCTADACWAQTPMLAANVLVADCLPVLLCSPDGQSVAAAHAGWRGLAGQGGRGVLESLVERWAAQAGITERAGIVAWLGPCIGPGAFEVGPEVVQAFAQDDPDAQAFFHPCATASEPKFMADLPALARSRLQRLGIRALYGNDSSRPWCTYSDSVRFFSHRRDSVRWGSTGRMVAAIWRQP